MLIVDARRGRGGYLVGQISLVELCGNSISKQTSPPTLYAIFFYLFPSNPPRFFFRIQIYPPLLSRKHTDHQVIEGALSFGGLIHVYIL